MGGECTRRAATGQRPGCPARALAYTRASSTTRGPGARWPGAPTAPSVVDVRVALVSTPFVAVPPPCYGGTELVVHALERALGQLGHEVTVFATGDSRARRLRARFRRAVWP